MARRNVFDRHRRHTTSAIVPRSCLACTDAVSHAAQETAAASPPARPETAAASAGGATARVHVAERGSLVKGTLPPPSPPDGTRYIRERGCEGCGVPRCCRPSLEPKVACTGAGRRRARAALVRACAAALPAAEACRSARGSATGARACGAPPRRCTTCRGAGPQLACPAPGARARHADSQDDIVRGAARVHPDASATHTVHASS